MAKYHINKNGVAALCKATKRLCPLGEHFDTEEEANNYIQSEMSTKFGIIPIVEDLESKCIKEAYDLQLNRIKKGFKTRDEDESARTRLAKLAKLKQGKSSDEVPLADVLQDLHSPDSGATMSIKSKSMATVPTTGFCASPYPQHSKVFDSSKDVSFDSILDFMNEIKSIDGEIFSEDETYIGLWNDPQTGKVYLDISKRYHTAKEARIACEENDQIAYFDLQTFECVDVDRSATSGQNI